MIEKLETFLNINSDGEIIGEGFPSKGEIMDKINEIIDEINKLKEK